MEDLLQPAKTLAVQSFLLSLNNIHNVCYRMFLIIFVTKWITLFVVLIYIFEAGNLKTSKERFKPL